jgi:hypothetical protein
MEYRYVTIYERLQDQQTTHNHFAMTTHKKKPNKMIRQDVSTSDNNDDNDDDDNDDDDEDEDETSDRINIMDGLSSEALAALLEFQLGNSSNDNTNEEYDDKDNDNHTKFDKDTLCATYRPEDASRIAETLRRLHDRDHGPTTTTTNNNEQDHHQHNDINNHDETTVTATVNEITILPMIETSIPSSIIENEPVERIRHLVQVLDTDGVIRVNHVLAPDLCKACADYIHQTLQDQDGPNNNSDPNVGRKISDQDDNTVLFGNVFARDHRYDMYLHPFRETMIYNILSILLHPKNSILGQIFQMQLQQQEQSPAVMEEEGTRETITNTMHHSTTNDMDQSSSVNNNTRTDYGGCGRNPSTTSNEYIDAEFHELSSLISDPGSIAQPLHPDSPYYPRYAPLWTVFIALQDITPSMGGTVVVPYTHTEQFHQPLRNPRGGGGGGNHHNIQKLLLQSNKYQYYRADLNIGDCIVMDSRTFHYGGANQISSNACRRTLLYFTIRNPYHRSRGYPDCNSLYPDLDGTLKLSQFF